MAGRNYLTVPTAQGAGTNSLDAFGRAYHRNRPKHNVKGYSTGRSCSICSLCLPTGGRRITWSETSFPLYSPFPSATLFSLSRFTPPPPSSSLYCVIAASRVQHNVLVHKGAQYMVFSYLTPAGFRRYSSLHLCPPYPARDGIVSVRQRFRRRRNPSGKHRGLRFSKE